jgi:hypothetical protein
MDGRHIRRRAGAALNSALVMLLVFIAAVTILLGAAWLWTMIDRRGD